MTAVAVLASCFALALVVLAVLSYRAVTVERRTMLMASVESEILTAQARLALQSNNLVIAQNALSVAKANRQIVAACIYNRDGAVFAKVSDEPEFTFPLAEANSESFVGQRLRLFRTVAVGKEVIGHVFLCAQAPSVAVQLSNRTTLFLCGCGVLFVLTVVFAIWLQRLLKLKAVDLEPLIPLVRPEADHVAEPKDIMPDEFRLLNKRVDAIENKVEKIEKDLARPPAQAKPRVAKTVEKRPVPTPAVAPEELSTALDLNSVTKSVVQAMQNEIEAQEAEVTVQANLPVVYANRSVIEKVVRNLISNALTFFPKGSRPRIRIGGCITANAVRVWVHDNGIGMSPEEHQFIFTGSDREYIAMVKKDVERMRGQVGFDSAAGQGSTFWIELPKSETATLN